jgi:hypothetical protein
MDKLKNLFKKSDDAGAASSNQKPVLDGPIPQGVLMSTTLGDITIALYSDKTPKVRYVFPPQSESPANNRSGPAAILPN